VLFTSLGGTSYPWGSPLILSLIVASAGFLLAFLVIERHAPEPIVPLHLFAGNVFPLTSVLGFVVGMAMFGTLTFLPLYLQVVKGQSPTQSGLQLTPMMGGILAMSVLSGFVISRVGRYKAFPVIGFAVMTVALLLLARLGVDTANWVIALDMVVMGVGLGMVMQVLILAVQNAVDYRYLGVATAAATVFRGIGGSLGLAAFGAIFASRLSAELRAVLPAGAVLPGGGDPREIALMPAAAREPLLEAFTNALHPVFLIAAALAGVGFLLALFLEEVPLRQHVGNRPGPGPEALKPAAAE
jgi:hypothetical protein